MKNSTKRFVSIILTVIMVFSMFNIEGLTNVRKANAASEVDLRNFVVEILLKDRSGNYIDIANKENQVVNSGTFEVQLAYRENPETGGVQFPTTGDTTVTYTFPEGVKLESEVPTSGAPGNLTIALNLAGVIYEIKNNTYYFDNNTLYFTFNQSDPNFELLNRAGDAQFKIDAEISFDGTKNEIDWGNDVKTGLVFDDESNVKIDKICYQETWENSRMTIDYTLNVTSKNINKDVTVDDTFVSDFLNIDYSSVSFSSNKSGTVNVTKVQENEGGFRYIFPEMKDGEVITIKYSVPCDPSTISAAQIKADNKATVSSKDNDGNPTDDYDNVHNTGYPHTAHPNEVVINQAGITKSSLKTSQYGDDTYCEWKIVFNAETKGSVAGYTITDEITNLKNETQYDNGFILKKYNASGEQIGGDIDISSAVNIAGNTWSYTIPASDTEPYKYEITYRTVTDTTGLQGSKILNNFSKALDKDGNTIGTTGAQAVVSNSESKAEIAKDVDVVYDSASDSYTANWTIYLVVPKEGLNTARLEDTIAVVDDWNNNHNTFLKDELVVDSFNIEGLIGDERYVLSTDTSDKKNNFSIVFYKGTGDNQGLYASEGQRTLKVTYQTILDKTWIDNFSANYQHKNTAKFFYDGDDNVSTEKIAHTRHYEKLSGDLLNQYYDSELHSTVEMDGANPLVFQLRSYYILFSAADIEEGKEYTFTDTYDSKYLQPIVTGENYRPGMKHFNSWFSGNPDNDDVGSKNGEIQLKYVPAEGQATTYHKTWNPTQEESYANISYTCNSCFSYDEAAGQIVFTIDTDELARDAKGDYYPYYAIVYYLRYKKGVDGSEELLNDILANNCLYTFENTVENDELGEVKNTDWTVDYAPIAKTEDPEKKSMIAAGGIYPAEAITSYTITLNEEGKQLNGGNDYTVIDTPSNISINYNSIVVTPSNALVSHYPAGGKVYFTVKDGVPVTITYDARVIIANSSYSNTLEFGLNGESITSESKAGNFSDASGTASVPSINILKFDSFDMDKRLNGAKFQLLEYKNNKTSVPDNAPADEDFIPMTKVGGSEIFFVTKHNDESGKDGEATVFGDHGKDGWSLITGKWYALVEVEPPKGYKTNDVVYKFRINKDDIPDYDKWYYANNDTLTIKNTTKDVVDVSAKKVWVNDDGSDTAPGNTEVVFGLYNATTGDLVESVTLDGTVDSNSDVIAGMVSGEAVAWQASFVRVPKYEEDDKTEIQYIIKEITEVPGYRNLNPNGVLDKGTITNKQAIISISVHKLWADEDGEALDEIPEGVYAKIGLYDDDTTKDPIRTVTLTGTASSDTDVQQGKKDGEATAWYASFVDLPKYNADGDEILYYVKEIECSDGFGTENEFYGYDPEGDPIEIVNKQILINIDFQKEWKDPENYTIDPPDNASVEFTLLKDGVVTGRKVVLDGSEDTDEYKNSHQEFESNTWRARFINLPEYRYDSEGAHKIEYKVRETKGYPGFTPVGDSDEHNKITNKKDVEKINLSVTKAWLDVNELRSTAPKNAKVTLALYTRDYEDSDPEDDTPLDGRQVVLNGTASTDAYKAEHENYASGAWTATFENLPKYKYESGNENEIIYVVKVSEENCTGYKLLDKEIVLGGDTISGTVHNMQENTSVSVSKSWKDLNNEENIPLGANVVFSLFKRTGSGETVVDTPVGKTVTLDGSEDSEGENSPWEASFNNLPKYSYDSDGNATEIVYVVKETTPYTGYTASYKNGDAALNGETITNTQTTITAKVLKVWDDADNHDGARPESIAVTLKNGETIVHSTNLSAQNEWTAFISGLPMYSYDKKGVATEINYTWTEDDTAEKAGYTLSSTVVSQLTDTEGTLTTLTNSRGIEKVSVSAKKVWQNGSGTAITAPENIRTTFEIYRNDEATGITLTLDGAEDVITEIPAATANFESPAWTANFTGLEKNDEEGNPYTYTVKEVSAPTGFTNQNPDGVANEGTITNKQEEISVSASKEWILASGTTLPENAAVMFGMYERMAGSDGDKPLATVVLDGTADTESTNANYDVRESASWTASFGNLPKYKYDTEGNAVPIVYVIKENENALHGFTNQNPDGVVVQKADGTVSTGTITNKQDVVEITVSKKWQNANGSQNAPANANIVFTLFADNTATGKTITLDGTVDSTDVSQGKESGELAAWTANFVDLPKYDSRTGNEIAYTVKETTGYTGYTVSYGNADADSASDEGTITNIQDVKKLSVRKIWDDSNNQDGKRPESLVMTLSNGIVGEERTVTLNVEGEWKGEIDNLPVYRDGVEIVYTWIEGDTPEGYTLSGAPVTDKDGLTTFTNKYGTEIVSATVIKNWEDGNNRDGIRPRSITVKLFADGVDTGKTAVLNADNSYTETIDGLPKYKDGKVISYTWQEPEITGYERTGDSTSNYTTTITNTHETATTQVSVSKVWMNADGTDNAPEGANAVFELYANGVSTGKTVTLDGTKDEPMGTAAVYDYESAAWTASFTNLDLNENGNKITYTVKEKTGFTGYSVSYGGAETDSAINGGSITNNQDVVEVLTGKKWKNADGSETAPEGASVVFTLFADGKATNNTVKLDGMPDVILGDSSADCLESEAWTAMFKKLPEYDYASGTPAKIAYTVKETTGFTGYTASYPDAEADSVSNGGNITNTQGVIGVTAGKKWKNADGSETAPEGASVVFTLYADGNATDRTVTLNGTADTEAANYESEAWTASFTGLPEYSYSADKAPEKIVYTVKETTPFTGYAAESDETAAGGSITNAEIVVSVSAIKAWSNVDNTTTAPKDASVVFTLYADDKITDRTVTLDGKADELTGTAAVYDYESAAWTASFTNLPKYRTGTTIEIIYTIDETSGTDGYTKGNRISVTNGGTITNKQNVTQLSVKKIWNDSENQDGKRPVSLTVTLNNGSTDVGSVTLSDNNGWQDSISNLPEYDYTTGNKIVYSWSEDENALPEGYKLTGNSTENDLTTLTNSYTPGKTEATVKKVWNDAENQDAIRPASISVQLMAGDEAYGDPIVLNDANEWKATVSNLEEYAGGNKIAYSWTEVSVPAGYVAAYSAQGTITTITNTHVPETAAISVSKAWVNADGSTTAPNGANVTFSVFEDGKTDVLATVTLDGSADKEPADASGAYAYERAAWTASYKNLPKYRNVDGKAVEIKYVVKETTAYVGYTASYANGDSAADGETITNSEIKTSISVKKVWSNADQTDTAPKDASVVFTLYADGVATDKTVTLDGVTDSDGEVTAWIASFDNLPKYKTGTTTEIVYTVDETSGVQGYTKTNDASVANGEIITNKQDVTVLSVAKVWDDAENQDGKRPVDLTVTLNNGSMEVGSVVLSNGNNWTGSISGLPVYDYTTGNKLVYSWSEGTLPDGYSMTKSEDSETEYGTLTTITNSYTPGKVSVSVKKVWDDAENQDGKRPASVSVELKNGNTVIETVELNEANKWTATVSDLDEYAAGNKIVYTWSEVTTGMPEGYELSDSVTEGQVTTLTNSYRPETIGVSVKKAWINADKTIEAPDGANAVFGLFEKDGTDPIATVTLDGIVDAESGAYESAAWTASFVNLPRYRAGEEIEYVVKETVSYAGYTVSYASGDSAKDGETITNTQDVVSISVKKEWSNADGTATAPKDASVVFTLYADGNAVDGKTISLDGAADSNGEKTAWIAEFEALPKYKTGTTTEIVYTVDETSGVTGYTKTNASAVADGGTITNKQDVTQLSVKKVWDDSDDQDGKRPESLTVTLSNGSKNAGSVTLNEANSWTATISNLPVYDYVTGNKLTYLWNEGDMPEGYSLTDMSDSETADGKLTTLTNSYEPGKIAMTVRKVWDDADNQDGVRPESLDVLLLDEKSKVVDIVSLNEDNGWTGTIDNLDEYGNKVKRVYTWSEDAKGLPEGYALTNTVTEGQITTLTNTYVPETVEIKVNKAWLNADGSTDAPDGANVVFALFTRETDGETVTETDLGMTVTLDGAADETDGEAPAAFCESESWTAVFKNLPKYKPGESGVELTYFVKEITEYADYTNLNPEGVADGETITNKQDTGSILIRKTIKGDITDEDRAGLTFVVKDKDGNEVGSYKLGVDFDEEKDDNDVVTGYSKTIEVPVGEYTVEETLYKFDGTTVTVSYKVDGGEAKEGDTTEAFEVGKEKTTVVEYENMYEDDKKTDNESQSSSGSTSGDSDERGPKTGDDMSVKALAVIAVISVTAAFFLKKKEEEE